MSRRTPDPAPEPDPDRADDSQPTDDETIDTRAPGARDWRRPGPLSVALGQAIDALKPEGKSWSAIAREMGRSETGIHRIKGAEVSVSMEMLSAFAEVFDVPLVAFLVHAGLVPVELTDDRLSAIVAGILEVPLATDHGCTVETAIEADPQLSREGKDMLLASVRAQRRMHAVRERRTPGR